MKAFFSSKKSLRVELIKYMCYTNKKNCKMMNISRVVNFSWFTFKWLQSTISYTLKSTKLPILLTIQEIKDFVQNEGISRTERYTSILQKEISCRKL